ncbi:3-hexulose-6-phosphate synthase/6-phospho-3-hexuloisomerase [Methanohalophilus levihalophilus]|uniref:3-hexulose-6-phosphate synthase n=1 Tax=Methanohalophilus levihalophilus TaxID=1431282 RepID=UPI001AE8A0FE|nr:3-hexulose-6-phosphate synthase [Methanohalophilus levihalophilus]MBP2029283.1 3-hexulose-6-phosphate synthase/6-phospho-3-hexuloisomerase [Methanohalophilus levihalophilus]
MRPIIQLALDILEIDRGIQIAKEALEGGIDWIEAGTPLIKSEGMNAVRLLRNEFPESTLLADMKIADTGALEVEMAAKAGADIVMILGEADDSTIADAVQSAHKYGIRLMADLMNVGNPVARAKELENLGIDIINIHYGIDQQMTGKTPVDIVSKIAEVVSIPVAAAGGLDAENAAQVVKAGAGIIIIGGNIIRSDNVTEAASRIRESVDNLEVTTKATSSAHEQIITLFKEASTPNITDAMHRKGAMRNIHPIVSDVKMVGKAITVQTFEGDWAKTVEAIETAEKGDVIVIYNGSPDIAPWGGLASLSCINRGIAGVVIDGAVRDVDEIRNLKFPLFATNIVPNAGDPKGFGEINAEIRCGGQDVKPGDYIIGDDNGVVVVPKEKAYEIARRANEVRKTEMRLYDEIKRGSTLSEILKLKKWEKY